MPELDPQLPILGPTAQPAPRPAHPSPTRDGLRLEVVSPREAQYLGHVFGVDTPYLMEPLGWGEWAPLLGGW